MSKKLFFFQDFTPKGSGQLIQVDKARKIIGIELDEDDDGKSPKPGTKKSRRYYPIKLPPELQNFEVDRNRGGITLKWRSIVLTNS